MNAYRSGSDLVGLLLRVSQGETLEPLLEGRGAARTHLAMEALLGCGSRGGRGAMPPGSAGRLMTGQRTYAESCEELDAGAAGLASAVPS